MISSRKLEDLHPDLIPKAKLFQRMCAQEGIDIIFICTARDYEMQNALYTKGRTSPGKIVTNARAGESAHNVLGADGKPASMAFDVVPVVHGKPVWEAEDPLWQRIGAIGASIGLLWAGHWTRFRELAHFQMPGFTPKHIPLV